jgi:pimeloyl-ACP methyl ester carboxylesterase
MRGYLEKIADALRVSPATFFGVALAAFVALLAASYAQNAFCAALAALGGVAIAGLGARAVLAPSRPFDVGWLGVPGINSSRRLGGFYIVTGAVWILLSISTAAA